MKNTIRKVFHSPKFLVGFSVFAAILLLIFLYPLFNPGNPPEMIGVGTFARPGAYVSLYDVVKAPTETLRLSDADDKRIAASISMEDRVAMLEWFTLTGVDVEGLELDDTKALLDLWFANYDSSVKPQGMTNARRNYYKRLDRSIQEIRERAEARFAERCRYASDECRYHGVAEKTFGKGRSYRCLLGVDKLREVYENE